ncbi:MAG: hypothetical protein ACOY71_08065, partial [Gemmatimonadota bacterium]
MTRSAVAPGPPPGTPMLLEPFRPGGGGGGGNRVTLLSVPPAPKVVAPLPAVETPMPQPVEVPRAEPPAP